MNNIISTKEQIFISLVGSSESGKSHLIHEWLTIGAFQPEFDKLYYFYQHYQSLYGLMSKDVKNIEFKEGVDFEFIQKKELTLSLFKLKLQQLEDIKDSAQYISNTIYFIRVD